ncbi:MAG: hypothetical protein HY652_09150 [Acidobacteria bacterium]|nr:hypothetical protein [Acidobacteriota bacterium]
MNETVQQLLAEVEAWCAGRSWLWRAPILLWLGYIGAHHLADPLYSSLFGGINLGIHEAGHLLFSPAGDWMLMAGGTILQLGAPIAAAILFLRQPDFFAVCVCGGWLSTNLFNVATYAADARQMTLPLVSLGHPRHDWNYLLGRSRLLEWDAAIATGLRACAILIMGASLVSGSWMLWRMARSRRLGVPDA